MGKKRYRAQKRSTWIIRLHITLETEGFLTHRYCQIRDIKILAKNRKKAINKVTHILKKHKVDDVVKPILIAQQPR